MAIAGKTKEQPNLDLTPKETPDPTRYKTSTVVDSVRPLSTIVAWVEGYSWPVNYYAQVLGQDQAPNSYSLQASPTVQQYKLINNLELKVQSELSYEYLKDVMSETLTGSAVILPGTIVPNVSDVFTVDVGVNRLALFTVTSVTPKTMLAESVYEIEYTSVTMLTELHVSDLARKVVDNGYFEREYLLAGKNPILTSKEKANNNNIQNVAVDLLNLFLDDFVNHDINFLTIPGVIKASDPYLMEFLFNAFETTEIPRLKKLTRKPIRNNPILNKPTVWDTILSGDMRRIVTHMGLYHTSNLKSMPVFGTYYYTHLYHIVAPLDAFTTHNTALRCKAPTAAIPTVGGLDTRPFYKLVTCDDYYVLSEAFYTDNDEGMSELESLLRKFQRREYIEPSLVLNLAEAIMGADDLERFYYTPIVLLLLNYVIGG